MTDSDDWHERVKQAIRALEATPAAPDWLVSAVRDGDRVAPALAPRPLEPAMPVEFFYPH